MVGVSDIVHFLSLDRPSFPNFPQCSENKTLLGQATKYMTGKSDSFHVPQYLSKSYVANTVKELSDPTHFDDELLDASRKRLTHVLNVLRRYLANPNYPIPRPRKGSKSALLVLVFGGLCSFIASLSPKHTSL